MDIEHSNDVQEQKKSSTQTDKLSNKENQKEGSFNSRNRKHKRRKDRDRERKKSRHKKRRRHKDRKHRDRRKRKRSYSGTSNSSRSSSHRRYKRRHNKRSYHRRKYKRRSRSRSRSNSYKRRDYKHRGNRGRYDNRRRRMRSISKSSKSKSSQFKNKKHKKLRFSDRAPSPPPHLVNQGKTINSDRFWNGFHWIERVNAAKSRDTKLINDTLKQRQVELSNLPVYLGITEKDIHIIINKFMIANFLVKKNNINPCMKVELDMNKGSALCEMTSVEEGSLFLKVEQIKILGQNCKINRVGENPFGQTINMQKLITNAEETAKAQAAAIIAINKITQKDYREELQLARNNILTKQSPILKISNLLDREKAIKMEKEVFDDIFQDLVKEFNKFGRIVSLFVIRPDIQTLGGKHFIQLYFHSLLAEPGSVFIEFEKLTDASQAYKKTLSQEYNNREIKIVYIQKEIYDQYFSHLNDHEYQPPIQQVEELNTEDESQLTSEDSDVNGVEDMQSTSIIKQNLKKPLPFIQGQQGEKKDDPSKTEDNLVIEGPPPIPNKTEPPPISVMVNNIPPPVPEISCKIPPPIPDISNKIPPQIPCEITPPIPDISNVMPPAIPKMLNKQQNPPPIPQIFSICSPIPIAKDQKEKEQKKEEKKLPPIPNLAMDNEGLVTIEEEQG